MQIQTGSKDLPLHTTVTLATILRDSSEQSPAQVLAGKTRELVLLRSRLAPEFIPLVDKYREVLETYLERLNKSVSDKSARQAQETIAQLQELDALRAIVRPQKRGFIAGKP